MLLNNPIDANPGIKAFAREIGGERIGLVVHRPELWAKVRQCIDNARKKAKQDGGAVVFGWTFGLRFAERRGHYLFATNHAVWHAQDGQLVDVTPFHPDPHHHPLTNRGSVIFLVDYAAVPLVSGHIVSPRPNRFFALTDSADLRHYLKGLSEAEIKQCERILEGGPED